MSNLSPHQPVFGRVLFDIMAFSPNNFWKFAEKAENKHLSTRFRYH